MLLFSVWASVLTLSITPIRSSGVSTALLEELAALQRCWAKFAIRYVPKCSIYTCRYNMPTLSILNGLAKKTASNDSHA